MVKVLLLILGVCFSANAYAAPRVFTPHLTAPAATVRSGAIAFQAFPGANGLQSFLSNALLIGLFHRLEIGSAPVFYFSEQHKYNFGAKVNFFKSSQLHMAFGGSHFAFETGSSLPDGSPAVVEQYQLTYGLFALNWFFTDRASIGVNFAKPWIKSSSALLTEALGEKQKIEWFVDVAYQITDKLAFTPGFGILRLRTLDPQSPIPFGVGGTFNLVRKRTGTFARVSLGLHVMPSVSKTRVLFSFSI